jgi:hypothetical protein
MMDGHVCPANHLHLRSRCAGLFAERQRPQRKAPPYLAPALEIAGHLIG